MGKVRELQADQILEALRWHPRVEHQGLASNEEGLERLQSSLPTLVPFGSASYSGVLPVIDWDHRLPSKIAILRIYAFYSKSTLRAGTAEMQARTQQINSQDKFPEFDVPDYSGLTADEAYEAEVDREGQVNRIRLVSAWRRDIDQKVGRAAVQITRNSDQFRKLLSETRGRRQDYLGDLEAVSWTPPCESNLGTWTIDVWYLMHLDASIGKGRSFLVNLDQKQVVGVREFVVRAS